MDLSAMWLDTCDGASAELSLFHCAAAHLRLTC
jgi:hypothetical protein